MKMGLFPPWSSLLERVEEFVWAGGWVLWPLMGVGCWLGTLLVLRALELRELNSSLPGTHENKERGHLLKRGETRPSHLSRRLSRFSMESEARRLLEGASSLALSSLKLELQKRQAIAARRPVLINTLVASAPLLGLLGTVNGMIVTFDALTDMAFFRQTGGIAGGIAEALITTQMGLAIAIPGLLGQRLLERQARRLRQMFHRLLLSCHRAQQKLTGSQEPSSDPGCSVTAPNRSKEPAPNHRRSCADREVP